MAEEDNTIDDETDYSRREFLGSTALTTAGVVPFTIREPEVPRAGCANVARRPSSQSSGAVSSALKVETFHIGRPEFRLSGSNPS